MQSQNQTLQTPAGERKPEAQDPATEFPVREYIGAMAQELAQMARWDGDEALAVMLEAAVGRAATTLERSVFERAPGTSTARPS